MSTLTIITEPTSEPVTVEEVKQALRIYHDDEDTYLEGLIKSSREWAEGFLNLYIMTQTVERSYQYWPSITINLGVWPLQSISSVKYDDTSSPITEQTLVVNTDYYADATTRGGQVSTITGWPSTAIRPNPIRIRMTAGYTSASNVPEAIKEGIKVYAAYLYDRDPQLEQSARMILWRHRNL